MPSDHAIAWQHIDCEHEDNFCAPDAAVTCIAPPEAICRTYCEEDCEEFWICGAADHLGHLDPGVRHDTRGHRLLSGECNAIDFILADEPQFTADGDYRDGPILVAWNGDTYEWAYI